MTLFKIKQHDTLPPLRVQLKQDDGTLIDLTGATVTLVVSGLFSRQMVVEDAAQSIVRYDWQDGDTATPGVYKAEVKVQYANARQTIPTDGVIMIHVVKEVTA